MVKNLPANAGGNGDIDLIPRLGRFPPEKEMATHSNPLLGNSMDREAWQAIVHGVAKSWTRLSNFTFTFSTVSHTCSMKVFFF